MSYNWTITDGDIYVSKNGDDVTGDGSMPLPYASINKATDSGSDGDKIVIGTGLWQEARGTSINIYEYIGDGDTILSGASSAWFTFQMNEKAVNISMIDYSIDRHMYMANVSGSTTEKWILRTCKIFGMTGFASNYGSVFLDAKDTLFDGILSIEEFAYGWTFFIENCIITNWDYSSLVVGSSGRGVRWSKIINSIFYNNPQLNAYGANTAAILSKNLFYTTTIKKYSSGTDDITYDSIYLDPKFNNESIGDYTLQLDSPCLFAGKNNAHIGAYGVGYNFDANFSEFTEEGGATFSQSDVGSGLENDIVKTSQTINGVTTRYFILNTDHTEGTIESEWIDFQTLYELKAANLFANFIYDEDGIATSRVDIDNNGTGEFPNQYDFEMKTALDEDDKDTATWQETIWNKELSNVSARFVKIKMYFKG